MTAAMSEGVKENYNSYRIETEMSLTKGLTSKCNGKACFFAVL